MKSIELKVLLSKYFEGETTIGEESQLREFFSTEDIPEEFQSYAHHFRFFSEIRNETPQMPDDEKLFALIEGKEEGNKPININKNKVTGWWLKIAAAIALLIIGFSAGILVNNQKDPEVIAAIPEETREKNIFLMANLNESSASERILTINKSRNLKNMDEEVLYALVRTMNYDENINVRLAAIEALSNFQDIAEVRKAVIHSLDIQENPIVQIALIDLLVKMGEKKAVNEMQRLLIDEQTEEVVKQRVQESLPLLM